MAIHSISRASSTTSSPWLPPNTWLQESQARAVPATWFVSVRPTRDTSFLSTQKRTQKLPEQGGCNLFFAFHRWVLETLSSPHICYSVLKPLGQQRNIGNRITGLWSCTQRAKLWRRDLERTVDHHQQHHDRHLQQNFRHVHEIVFYAAPTAATTTKTRVRRAFSKPAAPTSTAAATRMQATVLPLLNSIVCVGGCIFPLGILDCSFTSST